MAEIATNSSRLTPAQKGAKGDFILEKSTGNSDVTGNTDALAAFATVHARLKAAVQKVTNKKAEWSTAVLERDSVEEEWNAALKNLADVTQAITKGVAEKIVGAGFDIRALATPQQRVEQVTGLRVVVGPEEGYSEITWDVDPSADSYVLERSSDPIGPNTWTYVDTVTEARFTGNGATPGVKCWYRVRAVNRKNKGPWSEPALRAVM